jgi:hypothetical protein
MAGIIPGQWTLFLRCIPTRMASDQNLLTKKPNDETKIRIGRVLFQSDFDKRGGLQGYREFFQYYNDEINWLKCGLTEESDQTIGLVAKTHDDILTIVEVLREKTTSKRHEIRVDLHQKLGGGDEHGLNRSIDTAIRLWLMVNVRESQFLDLGKRRPCFQWNDTSTLEQFLCSLFPTPRWNLTPRESRLSPYFTAAFMVDVCDIEIGWTNSLEDHLRLDRQNKILWIYSYKLVLGTYSTTIKGLDGGKRQVTALAILNWTLTI